MFVRFFISCFVVWCLCLFAEGHFAVADEDICEVMTSEELEILKLEGRIKILEREWSTPDQLIELCTALEALKHKPTSKVSEIPPCW